MELGLKYSSLANQFKYLRGFIGVLFFQFFILPLYSQTIRPVAGEPSVFLKEHVGKNGIVVLFLDPECPMCQKYTGVLMNIQSRYDSGGQINFIGIFPGKKYSEAKILQYLRKYKMEISVFRDSDFYLTDFLKATVTPEVYILDSFLNVKYKGLIDNWFYSLGRRRGKPTEYYLSENLDSLIVGSPFRFQPTNAIGCFIK